MITLLLIAALFVAGLIWLVRQADKAPEGYEDENGFHYGGRQ